MRLLVLVTLMGSPAAAAPNITWPTSDDSISVLRGQLTLTLPLMTREPAGPWREVETFVLEDKKTAQLTLRIHETYASIGKDFRASVIADLRTRGVDAKRAKVKAITLAKPLVGVEVLPLVPKQSYDRNVLVYAAYVGTPEGTVQLLAFYLSTKLLAESSDWIDVARKITTSAMHGKSDVVPSEKTKLELFTLHTPKNWISIARSSTSIDVQMHEVVPLGGQPAAECVLHTGPPTVRPTGQTVKTARGKFRYLDVTWSEWTDDIGPVTSITERFSPQHIPDRHEHVHWAWCRAPTTARLAELRDMLERTE